MAAGIAQPGARRKATEPHLLRLRGRWRAHRTTEGAGLGCRRPAAARRLWRRIEEKLRPLSRTKWPQHHRAGLVDQFLALHMRPQQDLAVGAGGGEPATV